MGRIIGIHELPLFGDQTSPDVFKVITHHKTVLLLDAGGKFLHSTVESKGSPLYAMKCTIGLCFFVIIDGMANYIVRINGDYTVELAKDRIPFAVVNNDNGTLSFKIGSKFLRARRGTETISRQLNNLSWEHFTLLPTNFISASDENVFTVRTAHGTKIFLDSDHRIRHEKNIADGGLPLYAQRLNDELSLFVLDNNAVRYVRTINDTGAVLLSDERTRFRTIDNDLDDSLSILQDGKYLSARKAIGRFSFVLHNQEWEHYFRKSHFGQ